MNDCKHGDGHDDDHVNDDGREDEGRDDDGRVCVRGFVVACYA